MIDAFIPRSATRVVVCLQPVDRRWGAQKLGAFCREVLRQEPDDKTCFLFSNARRDTLLLYFTNDEGEQTLEKRLEKGAFLLPAPDATGKPFVVLPRALLPRLFRS